MAGKSSIKRLPPELREEFDRFLASAVHLTIDDICGWLNERLEAHGLEERVSRSAVGRYSQQFERVAAKIRATRELSAVFTKQLGEAAMNDSGRFLVETVRNLVFNISMAKHGEAADTVDPKDAALLARAMKDLASAAKLSVDVELKIREEAKREAQAEMRRKLDAAVDGARLDPAVAEEALRALGFA